MLRAQMYRTDDRKTRCVTGAVRIVSEVGGMFKVQCDVPCSMFHVRCSMLSLWSFLPEQCSVGRGGRVMARYPFRSRIKVPCSMSARSRVHCIIETQCILPSVNQSIFITHGHGTFFKNKQNRDYRIDRTQPDRLTGSNLAGGCTAFCPDREYRIPDPQFALLCILIDRTKVDTVNW